MREIELYHLKHHPHSREPTAAASTRTPETSKGQRFLTAIQDSTHRLSVQQSLANKNLRRGGKAAANHRVQCQDCGQGDSMSQAYLWLRHTVCAANPRHIKHQQHIATTSAAAGVLTGTATAQQISKTTQEPHPSGTYKPTYQGNSSRDNTSTPKPQNE